jgi:hypothetical protein
MTSLFGTILFYKLAKDSWSKITPDPILLPPSPDSETKTSLYDALLLDSETTDPESNDSETIDSDRNDSETID